MHRVTPANAFVWDPDYGGASYNLTAFVATWADFWRGRRTPFGLRNTTFTAVQVSSMQLSVNFGYSLGLRF